MSVVCNRNETGFTANEVMWAKKAFIDAIVQTALVNQTEAFIDMIIDGERPADITRDSVNEILKGVKESTQEFLNDMVADLQFALEARLREVNYGASVTGIKYDLAGDVTDIEVDISVS